MWMDNFFLQEQMYLLHRSDYLKKLDVAVSLTVVVGHMVYIVQLEVETVRWQLLKFKLVKYKKRRRHDWRSAIRTMRSPTHQYCYILLRFDSLIDFKCWMCIVTSEDINHYCYIDTCCYKLLLLFLILFNSKVKSLLAILLQNRI